MALRGEEGYERFQQALEIPMLVASVAFVPLVILPEVTALPEGVEQSMEWGSWAIWAMFAFEYIGLLYLAPNRWTMVKTHVFDLIVIVVPFLRPLRILRLARFVSVLGRIVQGASRVSRRRGFSWFLVVVISVIAVGGLIVYEVESAEPTSPIDSLDDGLWWAIVTTTTVGYGDYYPVTAEGKAVAVVLMMLGIALLSVVTANIAAMFVASERDAEVTELRSQVDRLEAKIDRLLGDGPDDT